MSYTNKHIVKSQIKARALRADDNVYLFNQPIDVNILLGIILLLSLIIIGL